MAILSRSINFRQSVTFWVCSQFLAPEFMHFLLDTLMSWEQLREGLMKRSFFASNAHFAFLNAKDYQHSVVSASRAALQIDDSKTWRLAQELRLN